MCAGSPLSVTFKSNNYSYSRNNHQYWDLIPFQTTVGQRSQETPCYVFRQRRQAPNLSQQKHGGSKGRKEMPAEISHMHFLFPKRTDTITNTLHKERRPPTSEEFSNRNGISYSSRCGSRKQWQDTTTGHDHVVHHLRDEVDRVVHKHHIVTAIHKVHHSFCRMAVQNSEKTHSEQSFIFWAILTYLCFHKTKTRHGSEAANKT